jgi:hypothetical protein
MTQWRESPAGERQYLAADGYWYAVATPAAAPSYVPAVVPAPRSADGFNAFGRFLFGGRVRAKLSYVILFAVGVVLMVGVIWLAG